MSNFGRGRQPTSLATPGGGRKAGAPRRSWALAIVGLGVLGVLGAVGVASRLLLAPQWDPALEPYVSFVEEARGHEFRSPVPVVWMSVEDAVASGKLAPTIDDAWARPYQVLGLLPASLDASGAQAEMLSDFAAAYYDPSLEAIVLPPADLDLADGATIVHELTHALQHQHGLLGRARPKTDNEALATTALIEGDATRIENLWIDSLSDVDRESYFSLVESRSASGPALSSSYLEASFYQSYALGAPAAELIVHRWGVDELDDRLSNGVESTEYLLDPFSPSESDGFSDRPMTDGDRTSLGSGSLGPVVWYQVLAPTIGREAALDAVLGYGKDEFTLFETEGGSCLEVVYWSDTAADRNELATAFELAGGRSPWLATLEVAEGATWLTFDICDPIVDQASQGVELLSPLTTLAWVTYDESASGMHDEVVQCVAPQVAASFEPSEDPTVSPWDQIDVLVEEFRSDCA